MQLDNRISRAIIEISRRLKRDIALLDETGEVLVSSNPQLYSTLDEEFNNLDFENGMAKSSDQETMYLQIHSDNYRPLCLAISGAADENAEQYGYLIVSLLEEILKTTLKKPGREEVFRRILLDQIDPLELQESIRDFKLNVYASRCVILVQTFDGDAASIYALLNKLFTRQSGDIVVSLNRYAVALVKVIEDDNGMDEIIQLTQAIDETIQNELAISACLGVGNARQEILSIRDSFKEAQEAINLGLMQQNNGSVFLFQRLLLERFLQEVPRDIRKHFYELAYNDTFKKLLNEEMLTTILKFFQCNLNLSETARKLYIHRNTLIYRLDKIQKVTGLDLRDFEDAVLLKIMIMLGKSLSASNRIE